MTQQQQHEFRESLEEALSWMQAVHEKLKQIDNTEGPRPALEARLRETERIRESETEGHVKMDRVLVASEALVRNGDEEMKNQTHQKLKDLKALWEDTSIYIIHCHSRIEWVWLHWSEYLKAHEEFGMWLEKMHKSLEPLLEMQLGLQEKLWQVDHLRILQSDVQAQAQFLERLLDEAAVLFDRTEDPSMDEKTQKSLQDAYIHIRDRAQERLALAQKIAEEHQQFNTCVQEFQDWLVSKTKEVSQFSNEEDSAPNRLKALQDLDASIAAEELILQHIEGLSEAVKADTSPAGADKITVEVEELRLSWERLRQAVDENQKEVLNSLDSEKQYSLIYEQLKVDISHLRDLVQNLSTDLEGRDGERTEENMVTQWKTHTGVRNKLIAEEPGVEELKRRLKELFRFPHDSKALSDEMLAVVKEYQSVKGRSFRLSSESETALRQVLQDPLYGFSQWSQAVSQVMEASAEVTEFAHIALVVQNIEKLLKNSVQLQERLSLLQVKSDLLSSVFGQEKAEDLLEELSGDMRKRELLHSQLQQRKNRLQGLISKTKHFSDAYDSIHQKLSSVKEKLLATKGLQPDILTKKSQADQLRVIRKDLEDCEAHIIALETLVSSNSTNRTKFERLYTDWKLLHKAVWMEVKESEESIAQHESFHDNILNLEKWLMIMKQKLESFRGSDGEWSVENRQHEAERALGEFPEKELQLHKTEAQGQTVLSRTSEEGKVHISQDLKRLRESWMSLHTLSLNLYRLLNGRADSTSQDPPIHKAVFLQHCTDGGLQRSGSDEVDAVTSTDREEEEITESIRGLEWTDTTGTTERVRGVIDANNDAVRMKLSSQIFFSPVIVSKEITESCSTSDPQTDSQGLRADTQAEHGEFEAWLHEENNKLAGFLDKKQSLSTRELRRRRNTLKALRADVVQGQDLFQKLMAGQASGSSEEDAVFEDLRYRWMLYKSKLKEAGDLQLQHEDTDAKKGQELVCAGKTSDRPGFLYRVWRVALPFILLLMALLLLAFLLPMMHRGSSCSLSNNFARSFNLMLRYNGPPPT